MFLEVETRTSGLDLHEFRTDMNPNYTGIQEEERRMMPDTSAAVDTRSSAACRNRAQVSTPTAHRSDRRGSYGGDERKLSSSAHAPSHVKRRTHMDDMMIRRLTGGKEYVRSLLASRMVMIAAL